MFSFDRDPTSNPTPERRSALVACAVAALVPPVVLFGGRSGSDGLVGFVTGTLIGISVLALIRARKRA